MDLEFDFVPHDINNIFQKIKHTTAFSRHLLINTRNKFLWHNLISIDPYSLNINKNESIHIVINILQTLKHYVPFYTQQHKLKDNEIKEIKSYDVLLDYLQDRLKNGKPKTYKNNSKKNIIRKK
jgi:hypothetical protein